MNARHKLNGAAINGALVIAGVIGLLAESFSVFAIALAGLVISSICSGSIRPSRRRH